VAIAEVSHWRCRMHSASYTLHRNEGRLAEVLHWPHRSGPSFRKKTPWPTAAVRASPSPCRLQRRPSPQHFRRGSAPARRKLQQQPLRCRKMKEALTSMALLPRTECFGSAAAEIPVAVHESPRAGRPASAEKAWRLRLRRRLPLRFRRTGSQTLKVLLVAAAS
jgi:hypothetical protein